MAHRPTQPLPRDGVAAGRVYLKRDDGPTVLHALCQRFPAIERDAWISRLSRGRVLDIRGQALTPGHPIGGGLHVHYFREVANEATIPFEEQIVHADAHLVVVDKPHFLPVMPRGGAVRETLAARVLRRLGNPALVPLHRLDADTAGLVLFSANPATRDAYTRLFRERTLRKQYTAVVSPPPVELPPVYRSRLVRGTPFFRTAEIAGQANSETSIHVLRRGDLTWTLALAPLTGRKHQLRVHLATLGCPIVNDALYPEIVTRTPGDYSRPLQLLARALAFTDPVTGQPRHFESLRQLETDVQEHSD